MQGVTVQAHTAPRAPGKSARPVEVYDFRRPTTLAREHARVLEVAFETFARQWGTQLTAKLRVMSQITCEEVVMLTYDEYASSLPAATAMVLFELEGHDAKAVIQFPTTAGLSWIGHLLGGSGQHDQQERKFTQVEQALIGALMGDAIEDLRYSLGALLVTTITVDGIQYNSQFAQAAAPADLMICAGFGVRLGDNVVEASVAVPADALLPQLGEANPTSSTANASELIRSQVAAVPLDVSVRLQPAIVKPGAVLELAVGDVLPLPHPRHRPFEVAVGDLTLATAAAGASGSRLACVVVSAASAHPTAADTAAPHQETT